MGHILNSEGSTKRAGLRCQVSTFDPCLFLFVRETGVAAGSFTTHFGDILRRGGPDVLPKIRRIKIAAFGNSVLVLPKIRRIKIRFYPRLFGTASWRIKIAGVLLRACGDGIAAG